MQHVWQKWRYETSGEADLVAKLPFPSRSHVSPSATLTTAHNYVLPTRVEDEGAAGGELCVADPEPHPPRTPQRAATSRAKHFGAGDLQQRAGCSPTA